jgi:hypothetical protein
MNPLQHWERCVLAAVELTDPEAHLGELVKAYTVLSQVYWQEDTDQGPSGHATFSGLDDRYLHAIRGLIFGAKTFGIARWLLQRYPQQGGRLLEFGAGWGPFGVAAALSGAAEIELVEASGALRALARRLFEAMDLSAPKTESAGIPKGDGGETNRGTSVALPFVYGERVAQLGEARASRWIADWVESRGPAARVYIVEPGSKVSAHRMQRLRDRLASSFSILGPCPERQAACPLNHRPTDWCHFTWNSPLGELGRRIVAKAGRRESAIHFSWLVVAGAAPREPVPTSADRGGIPARVLQVMTRGREWRATLCLPGRVVAWVVPNKRQIRGTEVALLEAGDEIGLPEGTIGDADTEVRGMDWCADPAFHVKRHL